MLYFTQKKIHIKADNYLSHLMFYNSSLRIFGVRVLNPREGSSNTLLGEVFQPRNINFNANFRGVLNVSS